MAESFGSDPERYDRTRPRYPEAMIKAVVTTSPGPDFVDVGTGTGIAARQFQAAGCRVLGVEPDPRMADFARRGGLEVEVSTFETWDPSGRTFDAVVAGQTWHWVDPVLGGEKAARVLRPGGRLAVFWNVSSFPTEAGEAFAAVYERVLPDSLARRWATTSTAADGYSVLSAKAADGMRRSGAFDEPEQWHFEWAQTYSRDEWLDLLPTQGAHTLLPPAALAEVVDGIGAAMDALGGSLEIRYTTAVVTAVRAGRPGTPA
jgi:SAM-dependent methyltransferase